MTEPPPFDREKLVSYLLDEIEHPHCYSPKCVCLNLKQKIEYGDFDSSAKESSDKVLDRAIDKIIAQLNDRDRNWKGMQKSIKILAELRQQERERMRKDGCGVRQCSKN